MANLICVSWIVQMTCMMCWCGLHTLLNYQVWLCTFILVFFLCVHVWWLLDVYWPWLASASGEVQCLLFDFAASLRSLRDFVASSCKDLNIVSIHLCQKTVLELYHLRNHWFSFSWLIWILKPRLKLRLLCEISFSWYVSFMHCKIFHHIYCLHVCTDL